MADSARTLQCTTGDPDMIKDVFCACAIGLPGTTSPTTVTLDGNVGPIGGPLVAISGSPLTGPSIPGSGSTYWIIEVNTSTGAAQVKTSSSATPTPDAGNIVIFQGNILSSETSLAQSVSSVTVDN